MTKLADTAFVPPAERVNVSAGELPTGLQTLNIEFVVVVVTKQ